MASLESPHAKDVERALRAFRLIAECQRAAIHSLADEDFFARVCDAITHTSDYVLAWIGQVEGPPNPRVRPIARAGIGSDRFDELIAARGDRAMGDVPADATDFVHTRIHHRSHSDPSSRVWTDINAKLGVVSALATPIFLDDKVFGSLSVHAVAPDAFGAVETGVFESLSAVIALGMLLSNARRLAAAAGSTAETSLEQTVTAISVLAQMHDSYTAGHQGRVADLAVAIGKKLGYGEIGIHHLWLAGRVHDIGKLRVPVELLIKAGELSDAERKLVKTHATSGYEILRSISSSWHFAEIVGQHHERLDGSGYPAGLRDTQILPEARIISIADVVDAVARHRPYRPALGIGLAMEEIKSKRGVLYDADAVAACVQLFERDGYEFLPTMH